MADAVHTRRALLRAIPGLTAAVSVPAAALAAPVEDPHVKVRRLSRELAEALNDAFEGQFTAIVPPSNGASGLGGFYDTRMFNHDWNRGCLAASAADRLDAMPVEERAQHHFEELEAAVREMSSTPERVMARSYNNACYVITHDAKSSA